MVRFWEPLDIVAYVVNAVPDCDYLRLHDAIARPHILNVGEKTGEMAGRKELEGKLAEKLGGSLEAALAEKISEFGGLLTRDAACLLLCRQNGIEVEMKIDLAEAAKTGLPFSFRAKVSRIYPAQLYKNGTDRSVRLHISDGTGESTLVLWNEQSALVEGEIGMDSEIECKGAYARGGEIFLSRTGAIRKIGGMPALPVSKLSEGICAVEGEVKEVKPDQAYADKKSGEARTFSSFIICDPEECRRVIAWSRPQGVNPEPGDRLLLENVVLKNNEIHFNSYSRMVKKSSSKTLFGKMDGFEIDGDAAVFLINGSRFQVPQQKALVLLGIRPIPQGVAPATLLSIKSSEMVGRSVKYRLEEEKLAWLSL